MNFEVGQVVKCINASPGFGALTTLTHNKLYRIRDINGDPPTIRLEEIAALRFLPKRFKPATFTEIEVYMKVMGQPKAKPEVKQKIELNAVAKKTPPVVKQPQQQQLFPNHTARPAFSSLPIYRLVRKKITDDVERIEALAALKREYTKKDNVFPWVKGKHISGLFIYDDTPEGHAYWIYIVTRLYT